MDRRAFLRAAAVLPFAASAAPSFADETSDRLKSFVITRVIGFRHVCPRPKYVGKNSHLDDHGDRTSENCLRILTEQGVEGVGIGHATPEIARQLLGHSLDEFWKPGVGAVSPLGRADHALFDLVGKALEVPSWKLIGGRGPEWVDVYDGSIYFNDLLTGSEPSGVSRILKEVEQSLERGHRALKIKVGRGFKWMEPEAGFRRDVEVMRAIRKLVGKDVRLMVDANNGFDLDGTKRWLDAVDDDLFFVEEMFPENVEQDLELKAYLKGKGWRTRVADGESAHEVEYFDPYIRHDALDVLQGDIRAFGLTKLWELSRRAESHPGIRLAPHNWGSNLGVYMMMPLARGIPNFPHGRAGHQHERPVRHLRLRVQGRQDARARRPRLRTGDSG